MTALNTDACAILAAVAGVGFEEIRVALQLPRFAIGCRDTVGDRVISHPVAIFAAAIGEAFGVGCDHFVLTEIAPAKPASELGAL